MDKIRGMAGTFFEKDEDEILGAIERIFTLHMEAKASGLLALESSRVFEDEFVGRHFLQRAVTYVVDGMMPEKVRRLLSNRIMAETDLKKQFICLIYKTGMEIIQLGEMVYSLQEEMCSLFPESCEESVRDYIDDILKKQAEQQLREKELRLPEQFEKVKLELPEDADEKMKILESILCEKTDTEIQIMLRNMEHYDACRLLWAGSKRLRERIMDNMSKRLRLMAMEDVIEGAKAAEAEYDAEVEQVKRLIEEVLERIR